MGHRWEPGETGTSLTIRRTDHGAGGIVREQTIRGRKNRQRGNLRFNPFFSFMSHSLTSPPRQTCPASGVVPAGGDGSDRSAAASLARLGTLLQRAVQAHGVAVADCGSDRGLSDARFRILDALSGQWGSECTQSDLAARLRQSESHLSELLEGLADGGFISRERSTRDRRKTLVRATPAGVDVAAAVAGQRDHRLRERLAGWSGDQVRQLLTALNRLCHDLDLATAPAEPQNSGPDECPALARPTTQSPSSSGADRGPPTGCQPTRSPVGPSCASRRSG